MEQKVDNFKDALAFGQDGEKEVASLLLKKGYAVLPLYQFEDDISPKIIEINGSHISPDLTIFKQNKCTFLEVKRKRQWVEFKGVIETGCNYCHYLHYKKIANLTGVDLFMAFLHEEKMPTGIFFVNINEKGRYWDGIVNGKKVSPPMFFWNIKSLKKINL